MKTIKNKLMASLVSMIIIIPIIMIIIFNIFINMYFETNSKKELKNTIHETQGLIKKNNKNLELAEEINQMLRGSKATNNIELLLFDNNLNNIYPDIQENYYDKELIEEIKGVLANELKDNVYSIRALGHKYYIATDTLNHKNSNKSYYLVLLSKESNIKAYIRDINYILVITMIIGVLINVYISNRLSKSISKPIGRLSDIAKAIGNGKFDTVEADKSTVEIYNLYNSINLMAKRLKENEEAQKKFLQNASHEMRTPLMSIQGYSEGIEKEIFEDNSAAAKIIKEESIRLNQIVSGLLNLSRIENRLFDNELYTINIVDILKVYIEKLQGYALSSDKSIVFISKEEEVLIKGEENLLSQIFINIISNSVKYASEKVMVEVKTKGKYIEIIISDDGKGISEEDLPHIFERFYKGENGNFGLGLSIAKAASEALNGSIEVKNEEGATFIIRIPAV